MNEKTFAVGHKVLALDTAFTTDDNRALAAFLFTENLDDAVEALGRAASHDPPAYPWSVAWFTGCP